LFDKWKHGQNHLSYIEKKNTLKNADVGFWIPSHHVVKNTARTGKYYF